ncbi:MAG: TrkH family potassium uptake protein [Bacillota bacterium]
MNWKSILKVFGFLLTLLSASMLLPLGWALHYGTPDFLAFAVSIPVVGLPGIWLMRAKSEFSFGVRESYMIVAGGWIVCSIAAAIPYVISGVLSHPIDAIFETMSGFTTTGATVMREIEISAAGILFWRSYLHWLGGMGMILLFLAIMPRVGLGRTHLYRAEVPGAEVDRMTPRLRSTASLLWKIYGGMTLLQTLLLCLAGMSLYDSLIHTFGTVATGGFSNRTLSVGAYGSPWVHYIIVAFMLLAGMNFGLYYKALLTKSLRPILEDKEARLYLAIVLVAVLIVGANLSQELGAADALHHGSFQVVSVITTTGYSTVDFDKWPDLSRAVLLLLMFVGPCAGSTGGAMKVIRYLVVFKSIFRELSQMIHAKAVLPIRIGKHVVPEGVVRSVVVFTVTYLGCALIGTLYMLGLGMDMVSALSAVAATLGNIGPGLGSVGPMLNYALIPASGKAVLTFLMLLGRLELFTVLVCFAPAFWRKR